jgi:hypothetical protein
MLIFVASDLHSASKMCEQPWYVMLCYVMLCYVMLCVWGEFTAKGQRRSLTPLVKKTNELYFGCKAGDQDRPWAPHTCCGTCAGNL